MNLRDRVRQSATYTGLDVSLTYHNFALDGAAEATYRTVGDAYDTSSVLTGTKTINNVPLLIERSNDEWEVLYSTLKFTWVGPGAGIGTWTVEGSLLAASSTGSRLSLGASEVVTISIAPVAEMFAAISIQPFELPTSAQTFAAFFPTLTGVLDSGLIAVGKGASANGPGTAALGTAATAHAEAALAFGNNSFTSKDYSFVSGGPNVFANTALVHTIGFGQSDGFLSGAMLQYFTYDRGLMNGVTTDATPTAMYIDTQGGSAITNSDYLYCDAGLHVIEGDLTAISDAGEMKAWHIKVVVRTELDYSAAAIVGTPVTDELYESAGATTWAVTPAVNTSTQEFTLGVTGQVATNIVWGFAYTAKYNTVYV